MVPAKERQDGRTLDAIDEKHRERYLWAAERVHGPRVLDCACGVGYGSRMIAEANPGILVRGVDISKKAIRRAKRYFRHPRVRYTRQNMLHLDVPGGFGSIVSLESLEHVSDPSQVLEQFSRLLVEQGNILVSLPIFPTVAANRFHKFDVRDASEAERFFVSCGFIIREAQVQDVQGRPFGLFNLRSA